MVKIIGDPGSCHMGKFERAIELIRTAKLCGLDAVKFQLFNEYQTINGNIMLPRPWFKELKEYGDSQKIEVFASVWGAGGRRILKDCGCKSIKFAYTANKIHGLIGEALVNFENVYISGDILHDWPNGCIRLFCIPQYPVVSKLHFDEIFPDLADGFSDHTLGGLQAVAAACYGAKYIEKHFQLDDESNCPDGRFAIRPMELAKLVRTIRKNGQFLEEK